MAGAATEVDQSTFGEQDDALAVGKDDMVHLRLDVLPFVLTQACDVDFVVEVPDIADDRLVLHSRHILSLDDVRIAGCCNDDVDLIADFVELDDAIALHGCLKGADRINFGHPHNCAERTQRLG